MEHDLPLNKSTPTIILLIGMAGVGKTTVAQRINHYCIGNDINSYFINLDPAVRGELPYNCNIDIRDTVNYSEVMKQYQLGPNGAIMTSLNLFATKIHDVIQIIDKRSTNQDTRGLDYVFIDTPGQIEVFTWSASGQLITEAFISSFPAVLFAFICDATRCINPQTFTSTMLYASSIYFKLGIPLILCFNKTDVVSGTGLLNWMSNIDELTVALHEEQGYGSTLCSSLVLFIHQFYSKLQTCCISAISGNGMDELFNTLLPHSILIYKSKYLPAIQAKQKHN